MTQTGLELGRGAASFRTLLKNQCLQFLTETKALRVKLDVCEQGRSGAPLAGSWCSRIWATGGRVAGAPG